MKAWYMLSSCVCLSVGPSLRLSQAGSRQNFNGVTPTGAPNRSGVGSDQLQGHSRALEIVPFDRPHTISGQTRDDSIYRASIATRGKNQGQKSVHSKE